jgi:hypothetical protein
VVWQETYTLPLYNKYFISIGRVRGKGKRTIMIKKDGNEEERKKGRRGKAGSNS